MGLIIPASRDKRRLRRSRKCPCIGNLTLYHNIAVSKAFFHIPFLDLVKRRIIALKPASRGQTVVLVMKAFGLNIVFFAVHLRRSWLNSVLHVKNRRQNLILYLDQLQGLLRDLGGNGRHRCHGITGKTHMLIHNRPVSRHTCFPCRGVFIGHHGFYSRQSLCRGSINGNDLPVRIGTVENLRDTSVVELNIITVNGFSCYNGPAILTAADFSDMAVFCHAVFPPFKTDFTASITW